MRKNIIYCHPFSLLLSIFIPVHLILPPLAEKPQDWWIWWGEIEKFRVMKSQRHQSKNLKNHSGLPVSRNRVKERQECVLPTSNLESGVFFKKKKWLLRFHLYDSILRNNHTFKVLEWLLLRLVMTNSLLVPAIPIC